VRFVVACAIGLLLGLVGQAEAASWSTFHDPEGRFSIELPTEAFQSSPGSAEAGHFTFSEVGGGAIVDIYSGRNVQGLKPRDFIRTLSSSPRIADVSYSAAGTTWFAISGHYVREATDEADLIYYAKFVFTSDLSKFAAFEISYPVREKLRMDPIVTRLERALALTRTASTD
jgi:hypothetical protein